MQQYENNLTKKINCLLEQTTGISQSYIKCSRRIVLTKPVLMIIFIHQASGRLDMQQYNNNLITKTLN